MELSRDWAAGSLSLSQERYTLQLVERFGLEQAHSQLIPLERGLRLTAEGDGRILDTVRFPYSTVIGSLLYLAACTRPDIAFAVGMLARFMQRPTEQHWGAAMRVLRYLKGTADHCLVFGGRSGGGGGATASNSMEILGWADADFANDLDHRRSVTAYVFTIDGVAVSWKSGLQVTAAVSTLEAEYQAGSSACREALWLRKLMRSLGRQVGPLVIMSDNQGAIAQYENPISSSLSKHIDVVHHFVRERVARDEVQFRYCPTAEMVADALTKAVPAPKFLICKEGMGVMKKV
jgi:hypothetical protein